MKQRKWVYLSEDQLDAIKMALTDPEGRYYDPKIFEILEQAKEVRVELD